MRSLRFFVQSFLGCVDLKDINSYPNEKKITGIFDYNFLRFILH